jgi:hypothetical protein
MLTEPRDELPPSLDHLVSAGEQRWRHFEAERLGGRQIDDKFKFGWLLDWKVARLRSTQNLVDKVACAPEKVRVVCPIGQKASRCEIVTEGMNRRQPRAQRQGVDASVGGIY